MSESLMFNCRVCLVWSMIASILTADVNAATYMVGDDQGTWNIPATTNDLNYTAWAEARNFRFGDELVFKYDKGHHNVLRVNHSGFDACALDKPMATYSSGYDTVALNQTGVREYFFICGWASHCVLGQKIPVVLVGMVPGAEAVPDDAPPPPSSKSDANNQLSLPGCLALAISAALLMVSSICAHLI